MEANENSENSNENQGSDNWRRVALATAGVVVGGGAMVAAAPAVLTGVGFTTAGIAAGSLAAKMMSISAVWNGGGVPPDGIVAWLQATGAGGIGVTGNAVLAGGGAAAGGHMANKLSGENGAAGNNNNDSNGGHDGRPSDGPRE